MDKSWQGINDFLTLKMTGKKQVFTVTRMTLIFLKILYISLGNIIFLGMYISKAIVVDQIGKHFDIVCITTV